MLAYYETVYNGLVPCKVLYATRDGAGYISNLHVRVTAARGAYARGERLTVGTLHCIPRDCVYTVRGPYGRKRITLPYTWDALLPRHPLD